VTTCDNGTTISDISVLPGNLPILTGTVSITGTAQVGKILAADFSNVGGSGDFLFQWKRNGTVNIGANSSMYTAVTADSGSMITVTVSRSDNSGSVTSAPVGPVTGIPVGPVTDPHGNSIDANPVLLEFLSAGGSKSLQITANVTWQIVSDQAWCGVSVSSGSGDTSINVSVSVNESFSSRTAILSVNNNELALTKIVEITQSGVDPSSVIIYASYSGNDANDGKSWSTAVKNISTAIHLAPTGGNVWVEEGTYPETVVMKNGVNVYGGFNRTESSPGNRGTRRSTLLNNNLFSMTNDFTMPTIVDGWILNTTSAVQNVYTNVVMNNCEFKSCIDISGGVISNSVISVVPFTGYLISVRSGGKVLNSRITGTMNTLSSLSTLIRLVGGRAEGCIISGSLLSNSSNPSYIVSYTGNDNYVVNCTFINITGASNFISIPWGSYSGTLNFVNNVVFPHNLSNGTTTGLYSANNLMGLATTAVYFLNEDYSPMSYSPAVNAGDNSFVTVDKDILGNPRIQGGKVDIGAIESSY